MKRVISLLLVLALLALSFAFSETCTVPGLFGNSVIEFDESDFMRSSYEYNHALMRKTLALSMTGYGTSANFGETGDFNRDSTPKTTAAALHFIDYEAHNYDITLNDISSVEAYSFAHRQLSDGSELVLIVVRCADYGAHFADNFNVGTGSVHAGFSGAAEELVSSLESYIAARLPDARLRFWITGYSRAAATANVTAKLIDDLAAKGEINAEPQNVFCYTFATPATVLAGKAGQDAPEYFNIFNILSAYDVVPCVPLAVWGYARFGRDRVFGVDETKDASMYTQTLAALKSYVGAHADLERLKTLRNNVEDVVSSFGATVPDLDSYTQKWQELFVYFLESSYAMVTSGSISPETAAALEKKRVFNWAQEILKDIASLDGKWINVPILTVLARFGEEAVSALSVSAPMAALTRSTGESAYNSALAYMTLEVIFARRVSEISGEGRTKLIAEYTPMLLIFAKFMTAFEGHDPRYYMALANTLSEEELYIG